MVDTQATHFEIHRPAPDLPTSLLAGSPPLVISTNVFASVSTVCSGLGGGWYVTYACVRVPRRYPVSVTRLSFSASCHARRKVRRQTTSRNHRTHAVYGHAAIDAPQQQPDTASE